MFQFQRLLMKFALIAFLMFPAGSNLVRGQDGIFDEPLVTGESGGDSLAAEGDLGEPQVDAREQFMQKMAEAEALMQQKDWAGAVALYNEIMTVGRHPTALLNQGICFRELGSIELAISSISMAMVTPGANLEPGLIEQAYLLRGELYMETGRYREAVDDFTQATQLNPSNPEPLYQQGKALLRLVVTSPGGGMDQSGQSSLLQAVKSLERAIALRADYGDAYLERGRVLFRLRQIDYAIEDFQQAARISGANSEASADLGVAYVYRATQETYRPEPDNSQILQDLQGAIASLDSFLSGARLGERYPPWQPRDPLQTRPEKVMLSRGDTRITLGNEMEGEEQARLYRAGLADAEELLRYDIDEEDKARAHYLRGSALRLLGELDPAIDAFTRAIHVYESLGASYSDAYLRRGICYYYQQKFDLAIQDFQDASTVPTNPYAYEPRAMLWAGVVEARLGQFENAIRNYTRAIAAAPRYVPAYLNRGLAYMSVGRYEQAVEDFDAVLRQDPEHDQAKKYRELAQQP